MRVAYDTPSMLLSVVSLFTILNSPFTRSSFCSSTSNRKLQDCSQGKASC